MDKKTRVLASLTGIALMASLLLALPGTIAGAEADSRALTADFVMDDGSAIEGGEEPPEAEPLPGQDITEDADGEMLWVGSQEELEQALADIAREVENGGETVARTIHLKNGFTIDGTVEICYETFITIEGYGNTLLMENGDAENRTLLSHANQLTLRNVTLQGGEGEGYNNTGIRLSGSLVLDNATITGCRAERSGGAVTSYYGEVIMKEGSKITGNTARGLGGGVCFSSPGGDSGATIYGTVIMYGGAEISHNTVYGYAVKEEGWISPFAARGGGVYGGVTMYGGKISNNTAYTEISEEITDLYYFYLASSPSIKGLSALSSVGGGAFGTVTMHAGEISDNTAYTFYGGDMDLMAEDAYSRYGLGSAGGGVGVNTYGTLAMYSNDCYILRNKAISESTNPTATVHSQGGGYAGQLEGVNFGVIADNESLSYGSGKHIYASGGGVHLSGSSSNTYSTFGGELLITRNRVGGSENVLGQGGGVSVGGQSSNKYITLNGGEISYNYGDFTTHGGGIFTEARTSLNINGNTKILHNTTGPGKDSHGGGIFLTEGESSLGLYGGEIAYNTAPNGFGGGIFGTNYISITAQSGPLWQPDGSAQIVDDEGNPVYVSPYIHNNGAAYGGGIALDHTSSLYLNSIQIEYNTALEDGGGIYVGETAFSPYYEGMEPYYSSRWLGAQQEATLRGNVAKRGGGAYVLCGDFHLLMYRFAENEAEYGGGLYIDSRGEDDWRYIYLYESAFTGNTAQYDGGGVYSTARSLMSFGTQYAHESGWEEGIAFTGNTAGNGFRMYNSKDGQDLELRQKQGYRYDEDGTEERYLSALSAPFSAEAEDPWYWAFNNYDINYTPVFNRVIYDGMGGAPVPEDQTVAQANYVPRPQQTPQLEGFSFLGWHTADDALWHFAEDADPDPMPDEDLYLYAHYARSEYTVTYLYNDGTGREDQERVAYGALVPAGPDIERRGYTLTGWLYEDAAWDFETGVMPAKDITLVAQWEKDVTESSSSPSSSTPDSSSSAPSSSSTTSSSSAPSSSSTTSSSSAPSSSSTTNSSSAPSSSSATSSSSAPSSSSTSISSSAPSSSSTTSSSSAPSSSSTTSSSSVPSSSSTSSSSSAPSSSSTTSSSSAPSSSSTPSSSSAPSSSSTASSSSAPTSGTSTTSSSATPGASSTTSGGGSEAPSASEETTTSGSVAQSSSSSETPGPGSVSSTSTSSPTTSGEGGLGTVSSQPGSTPRATSSGSSSNGGPDNAAVSNGRTAGPAGDEYIQDNGTVAVFGNDVPLGGFASRGGWSLFNLLVSVMMLLSTAVAAVMLVKGRRLEAAGHEGDEDEETNGQKETKRKHRAARRLLLIVSGILPAILFLLLENLTVMLLFSRWTPLFAALTVLHLLLLVISAIGRRRQTQDEDAENA